MGTEKKKSVSQSRSKLVNASASDQIIREKTRKIAAKAPPALASQLEGLLDPLTNQDLCIFEWAYTVGNPWTREPAGAPALVGTAVVRTSKAQILMEINGVVGAGNFGFVCLCLDGWTSNAEPLTESERFASFNGGTQGYPVWSTAANYAAANFPAKGATVATTGLLRTQMPLIDQSLGANQRMRLVAAGLRGFTTAAESTACGKMAIVSTSRPSGSTADGSIMSSTYSILSTLPEDIVHFKSQTVVGSGPKDILSAFAVPCGDSCFDMYVPATIGRSTMGEPQLAFMVDGGVPGQTFTVQLVLDFEFTMATGHITGTAADPILPAHGDALRQVNSLFPARVAAGEGGHAGSAAFVNYLAHTAPNKIRHLASPLHVDNAIGKSGSFIGKGLQVVKNLVSLTPWGGIAKTGLNFLSRMFR